MLILTFQASLGRVSVTTDLWSDQKRSSKMALTAHYLARNGDGTLAVRSVIFAFHPIRGKHDGKTLAINALQLFDRVGITNKAS